MIDFRTCTCLPCTIQFRNTNAQRLKKLPTLKSGTANTYNTPAIHHLPVLDEILQITDVMYPHLADHERIRTTKSNVVNWHLCNIDVCNRYLSFITEVAVQPPILWFILPKATAVEHCTVGLPFETDLICLVNILMRLKALLPPLFHSRSTAAFFQVSNKFITHLKVVHPLMFNRHYNKLILYSNSHALFGVTFR
jgi:hypothetical protein